LIRNFFKNQRLNVDNKNPIVGTIAFIQGLDSFIVEKKITMTM